ncbi:MAG: hypothetical protein GX640_12780 [Fibrobacter sp.]|nr:hypothetical protein [Fibrobacter sp.]
MRKTMQIMLVAIIPLFSGCAFLQELFSQIVTTEVPTRERMQGVWEVTEAYDQNGVSILDKISFPPVTGFQLSSDNGAISTAGPMITYIVYGPGKYANVASKIDLVFNYTKIEPNNGEWFIDDGVVDRFTFEMRLRNLSVPGLTSLQEMLKWFGVYTPILNEVIYHKFYDVKVIIDDRKDSIMEWEFDDSTTTKYYMKDGRGEERAITLNTDSFSRCRFVLTKRVKDLTDLIRDASN